MEMRQSSVEDAFCATFMDDASNLFISNKTKMSKKASLTEQNQKNKLSRIDKKQRIGVLMGGVSSEREISLKSGKAVFEALKEYFSTVIAIDLQTDDCKEISRLIRSQRLDCAFIALHGRFGEDGQIQSILEELGIPYTGSGVNSSRLAMDKISSRRIFQINHLPVPRYIVLNKKTYNSLFSPDQDFSFPLVVKPACQGSSVGMSIVDSLEDLKQAIELAFTFDENILLEEYISGKEVTAGILGQKPLPLIEIVPKKRFFDYEAKYQQGMTEYIMPASIPRGLTRRVQSLALKAHQLLRCSGCSRADFIIRDGNTPFLLEVNTIPGFTATSLLPKAARLAGIDFLELCLRLIELAYAKV